MSRFWKLNNLQNGKEVWEQHLQEMMVRESVLKYWILHIKLGSCGQGCFQQMAIVPFNLLARLPGQAGSCRQGCSQPAWCFLPCGTADSLVKPCFAGRAAPSLASCCLPPLWPGCSLMNLCLVGKMLPARGHASSCLVGHVAPWSSWALQVGLLKVRCHAGSCIMVQAVSW